MAGGSTETDRARLREHVRPEITRAEEVAANASGENFPVALRVLPARYRRHLTALYCFARLTDDLGDEAREVTGLEPGRRGYRLRLLDELAADVDRIYRGHASLAGHADMARGRGRVRIPEQPFRDLIEANRQDQTVTRYETFDALLSYCTLSANPVGRIVLYVFGVATPRAGVSRTGCAPRSSWPSTGRTWPRTWARPGVPAAGGPGAVRLHRARPGRAAAGPGCGRSCASRRRAARAAGQGRAAGRHAARRGPAAVAGYVAGGRAALAAIAAAAVTTCCAPPRPRKPALAAEMLRAYARGR